ncbi:hypothetical protein VW35_00935 [Devosia soli]|uniref:Uncharacterized protein n=1 Tax=Devosia soli TaxID=361041 RepID=A0A0F5LEI8_9HYPH|nr:hypothetical protein VW35_00935 [Devosia soli]
MIPSHKMIASIAGLSLIQGRVLAAMLDERKEQSAITVAAQPEEPVVESRQVRRARERREAKARK